jgi:hypothetical protein
MTIMTPVKPLISIFQADKSLPSGYGGSNHERLLSGSSRPYMLAYYLFLYVLHAILCIGEEAITV